MREQTNRLPVEEIIPQLRRTLADSNCALLVAPPGSGKTTRVPLALRNESWLAGQTILMLEPRRLAARAAATYMARSLQEQVGEQVGYRIHMDSRVGKATRIQVITEGILTRMLQSDPGLEGVGAVIFDEFHERNIHADLGLALCRQAQALFRPDLRLLVMSATLDAEPLGKLLDNAPTLVAQGMSHPVTTIHLEREPNGRYEEEVVRTIGRALREASGDLLVFLPGVGEIRRVERLCSEAGLPPAVDVMALHGTLTQELQDRALSASLPGRRKIVLATSIAETSLTVDGVRIVVDAGWMRMPRFSPRTGMSRLETLTVSKAAADQRRGRAGRQGPGVCYRLWTKRAEAGFAPQSRPEILESDLAALALELAVWGCHEPQELSWLDAPPEQAYRQATELLQQLGALDETKRITPHGRRMAEIGMHPRLAHMVLLAAERGQGRTACDLAALLNNRDSFAAATYGVDLRLRLDALNGSGTGVGERRREGSLARVKAESHAWQHRLRLRSEPLQDAECCGALLALAYPDRIAQQRGNGRFLLSNGRGAQLRSEQELAQAEYLVAAELDDQGADSRIYLAAPITAQQLRHECSELLDEQRAVEWNEVTRSVQTWKRTTLGALTIQETALQDATEEEVRNALLSGVAAIGVDQLPWSDAARKLRQRMQFLHLQNAAWPDVSDQELERTLTEWLGPYLYKIVNWDGLKKLDWLEIIRSLLSWPQRMELEEAAPTHWLVPSGQRIAIDYENPTEPLLAVRLQELFGLTETPRIAWNRVPLLLHLLSPARRPVQVTRDLASFWRDAYFAVKKDLLGRYPKHYWPDDPLIAQATHRVKAKMNK